MKPELNAMYEASIKPESGLDAIRNVFLSSLHWRGDELWAGPIEFGAFWLNESDGDDDWCAGYGSQSIGTYKTKPEARAALEAAAKSQIETWFQEQAK